MNRFRPKPKEESKVATDAVNREADEVIRKMSDFSFFTDRERLSKVLPPFILVVLVTIVYISLSHFHVKSLREEEELKTELNELRSEYISVKSKLMKESKQSEVSSRLQSEQIKELRTPPLIIEVEK